MIYSNSAQVLPDFLFHIIFYEKYKMLGGSLNFTCSFGPSIK